MNEPKIAASSDAEWRAYYEKQSRELRKENAALAFQLKVSQDLLVASYERIAEFQEHERQTHEVLGALLGNDTSLEEAAKRMRLALEDCYTLALRMRRRFAADEGWGHIVRFCESAGLTKSILRGQEKEEGVKS